MLSRPHALSFALLAVLLTLLAHPAAGQSEQKADSTDADWLVLPYASYAPETKVAGGLVVGYYTAPGPSGRPSTVQGVITYTQRRQTIVQVEPELYLQGGRLRAVGEVIASEFPDSFFGIGGDTPDAFEEPYSSRYLRIDAAVQRRWGDALQAGPRVVVRGETDPDVETTCTPGAPETRLACGTVAGADGGWVLGLGARATWDERDSLYDPATGTFADASILWHSAAFGSRYTFGRLVTDVRGYRPLGPTVLAGNVYTEAVAGTAPFPMLAQLGGSSVMRGYREGRYRDRLYWAAQAEMRVPLFWRFKATVFANAGEVASRLGTPLVSNVQLAAGLGGRMRLTDSGVHGRIDLAYGAHGPELYISLGEAF